jgi:hypothetical protein
MATSSGSAAPSNGHATSAVDDSAEITAPEAAAMLRAALSLFVHWQLDDQQARTLLGQPAARTFARWKAGQVANIPYDTTRRLSYLMGIHKGLRHLFKEPDRAYAWVHRPNEVFGGQSALARMLAGDITDLATVRDYLDAERAGW